MYRCLALLSFLSAASLGAAQNPVPIITRPDAWKLVLNERLPVYGHRNWIVVADSAYPEQSADAIETIVSHADHLVVLDEVLKAVSGAKHVTPVIYNDQELKYLNDQDAPGISSYRTRLAAMLHGRTVNVLPHDQMISKLDTVSRSFQVLIIKTNLTLPYTSVFLQLDCAYWPVDAEKRLRAAMAADKPVDKTPDKPK
jgi:hypothetical protein